MNEGLSEDPTGTLDYSMKKDLEQVIRVGTRIVYLHGQVSQYLLSAHPANTNCQFHMPSYDVLFACSI